MVGGALGTSGLLRDRCTTSLPSLLLRTGRAGAAARGSLLPPPQAWSDEQGVWASVAWLAAQKSHPRACWAGCPSRSSGRVASSLTSGSGERVFRGVFS